MLADAAGEHERVEAAERGGHRGDPRAQAVHVDVEREPRRAVGCVAPARRRARRARACRRCRRARAAPSGARARRRARFAESSLVLQQPQQHARVDAARARRHHEPLERREAHRRVDASAPSAIAHSDAPAPRWQLTIRRPRGIAPEQLAARAARPRRARARGSRSGAAPSARATPPAARRWRAPRAASRGRRCRSRRPPAAPAARR